MDKRTIKIRTEPSREECLSAIKMTLIRFNAFVQELDRQNYYSSGKFTGKHVPLFSNVGKDIYMLKIGKDNWKIRLGGKDVCLVPHGWGQVMDNVKSITVDKS